MNIKFIENNIKIHIGGYMLENIIAFLNSLFWISVIALIIVWIFLSKLQKLIQRPFLFHNYNKIVV